MSKDSKNLITEHHVPIAELIHYLSLASAWMSMIKLQMTGVILFDDIPSRALI